MTTLLESRWLPAAGLAVMLVTAVPARAEMTATELAKLAQKPVANLISVPFQNNTNFNIGPQNKTQNILNIQSVIPIELNQEWNLITRTIMLIISQPGLALGQERVNGLGDIQLTGFLSPAVPEGGVIWGAGPIVQLPTHTDNALGHDRWGIGPSVVILHLEKGDPWVYGFLANNVWSVGGSSGSSAYNNFLLQPFLNYNFGGALYLTSSPIMTSNWKSDGWLVPVGGGIGKIFHLGKLPVNSQLSGYYNAVTPNNGRISSCVSRCSSCFRKSSFRTESETGASSSAA